jgi:hypothetical protein
LQVQKLHIRLLARLLQNLKTLLFRSHPVLSRRPYDGSDGKSNQSCNQSRQGCLGES